MIHDIRHTITPAMAPSMTRRRCAILAALALLPMTSSALAVDARLSWSAVEDARDIVYELQYRESGQSPSQLISTAATATAVPALAEGTAYDFALRACVADSTLCSDFSPTLTATTPYAVPSADFSANTRSGTAPLDVTFTATTTGRIDDYLWTLGNGSTATGASVETRYQQPGSYDVRLRVSGPGGSATVARSGYIEVLAQNDPDPSPDPDPDPAPDPDPEPTPGSDGDTGLLEVGNALLGDAWQWIGFQREWTDPVVVARPLSGEDDDPALVRIEGLTSEGFWARIQEWAYLDDQHDQEHIGWLVMNAGAYETEDGRWLEAGRIETDRTRGFVSHGLTAPFREAPVVLSAVTSNFDPAPVITRIRRVGADSFQIGMIEEEAADQSHGSEQLGYVALEPGIGAIGGFWAEIGTTPEVVGDTPHALGFLSTFDAPPVLLAQMQTTNGGNTANLRWTSLTASGVDLWIDEEQSLDEETRHIDEGVGYVLLSRADADTPDSATSEWTLYEDAEDGDTSGWSVYAGRRGATISNVRDTDSDSRVIALQGSGTSTGYRLGKADGSDWADSTHRVISWEMKYGEDFRVYIDLETSQGQVYLEYTAVAEPSISVWNQYVHHGLGTELTDGRWHRVERDLAQDLADGFPDAELRQINGFLIRGSGRLDNIGVR